MSSVKQAQAEAENSEVTTDILNEKKRQAAADADSARADANVRPAMNEALISEHLNSAALQRSSEDKNRQDISNNAGARTVKIGVPGVVDMSMSPGQLGDAINGVKTWLSPVAAQPAYKPAPSTTQTKPVFQKLSDKEFAPQSLFAAP